jgi:hypothetical protein
MFQFLKGESQCFMQVGCSTWMCINDSLCIILNLNMINGSLMFAKSSRHRFYKTFAVYICIWKRLISWSSFSYDKYNCMRSSTPASRTSVTLMPPPISVTLMPPPVSSVSERAESDISDVKVISTSEIGTVLNDRITVNMWWDIYHTVSIILHNRMPLTNVNQWRKWGGGGRLYPLNPTSTTLYW